MKVTIGLRTIKTAVGAAIAIMLANALQLDNTTAAGIITLLSVTNSRKSSIKTGLSRIASLVLGVIIAFVTFNIIGYNAVAFGFFLLFFIPLSVQGEMSEGIAPSSVLVTHFLIAKEMTIPLVANAFGLLLVGVAIAWLANLLLMPDASKKLQGQKIQIDEKIRQVLTGLSFYLGSPQVKNTCDHHLKELTALISTSKQEAHLHNENQLLIEDEYFIEYFSMRRLQVDILEKMNDLVKGMSQQKYPDNVSVGEIQELFLETATAFSESNDTTVLRSHLDDVLKDYREQSLPVSREEFELRAQLFALLNEFDRFLNVKLTFHQQWTKSGNHYQQR